MVWKLLSGLSIVCLGGIAWFAHVNSQQVASQRELLARAERNLEQAQERKKDGEETSERKTAQLAQREKDRDAEREEVVKNTATAQEKEAELALLKTTLDQVAQQVKAVQTQIDDAGDIEALVAQVEALKKDQTAAEGELANKEQGLSMAQQKLAALRDQVKAFEIFEERVRRGVVEPDFNARVSSVFTDWGFVTLNKGNNGGVFANALLDVKRGSDVVAKLRVKNVEPASSVADIVPGSLAEGDFVRAGDLVVAAADQPSVAARTTTGTVSKPQTDATAAPTAPMSSDPFGGGAMETAPPAMDASPASDPFGGSAPAMDGGAAPASDPFGGSAPAMDGGAAPASDPFGGSEPAMEGGAAPASDPFGGSAPAMEGGAAPDSDPFK
jgi:hypothetical protein